MDKQQHMARIQAMRGHIWMNYFEIIFKLFARPFKNEIYVTTIGQK
jgi:hypothetical protein